MGKWDSYVVEDKKSKWDSYATAEDSKPDDTLSSAVSKIESISAGPSKLEYAMKPIINAERSLRNAINRGASFGMINEPSPAINPAVNFAAEMAGGGITGEPILKGAGFLASKVIKPISKLFASEKSLLKASKMASKGIAKIKKTIIDPKYDEMIASVKPIDSSEVRTILESLPKDFPEAGLQKYIKTSKRLKGQTRQYVTGEELKNIKDTINKNINWKIGKSDPINNQKQETWFKLQELIQKNADKKFASLPQEYRIFKEMADDVNSVILERGTPGTSKLTGKLGDKWFGGEKFSERQLSALKELNSKLPKEEQFMSFLEGYRRLQAAKKIGAGLGIYGLTRGLPGLQYPLRQSIGTK